MAEEREAGRAEVRAEYEPKIKELEKALARAQKETEELLAQIEAVRAETRESNRRAEEARVHLDLLENIPERES